MRSSSFASLALLAALAGAARADDDDPGLMRPSAPPVVAPPPVAAEPDGVLRPGDLTHPPVAAPHPPVAAPRPPARVVPPPPLDAEEEEIPIPTPRREPTHVRLAIDLKLPVLFTVGVTSLLSAEGLGPLPELLVGLRAGRVVVELGIGVSRIATNGSQSLEGGGGDTAFTQLVIAPTLAVDVFQSTDGKVSLYVIAAPLIGGTFSSNTSAPETPPFGNAPTSDTKSSFAYGYQIGLGARVALHKNFALGLESGVSGQFFSDPQQTDSSFGVTSIYAALVGSFTSN